MVNIINLLKYLNLNGFLREEIGEYLASFITKMKISDIDSDDLEGLKKELDLNYYKPITSPECHWLTGSFKVNRLYLVAFATIEIKNITSEELDRMIWVYIKINEKMQVKKGIAN
jgi:hypothetical protein